MVTLTATRILSTTPQLVSYPNDVTPIATALDFYKKTENCCFISLLNTFLLSLDSQPLSIKILTIDTFVYLKKTAPESPKQVSELVAS